MSWTAPMVARLIEMRDAKRSGSDIADALNAEFSVGLSRCAVLGRLARMGLKSLRERRELSTPRVLRKAAPLDPARTKRADAIRREAERVVVPPPPPLPPLGPLVSFADLEPRHCRWPFGDPGTPGFGFCGMPRAAENTSYCQAHYRLAFNCRPRERVAARTSVDTFQRLGAVAAAVASKLTVK